MTLGLAELSTAIGTSEMSAGAAKPGWLTAMASQVAAKILASARRLKVC